MKYILNLIKFIFILLITNYRERNIILTLACVLIYEKIKRNVLNNEGKYALSTKLYSDSSQSSSKRDIQ